MNIELPNNESVFNDKEYIHTDTNSLVYVIGENGIIKKLKYEPIQKYIAKICQIMNVEHLDTDCITAKVYPKLKLKNTIKEIEEQIVMCATEMVTDHYDYPCIATWILVNNLHESTENDYLKVVKQLRNNINKKGKKAPIVSKGFSKFVKIHHETINSALRYDRDYELSVFGYRTLEKSYLKKYINGKIIERPQHMYMRVAIALHYRTNRMDLITETYELLSKGYYTQATPTLFNAGTTHEQLSSCFLLGVDDDMGAIGECWKDCAVISKYAGGIGINVSNVRVDGAYIHSTQGSASGMRLLTVFNQIARYADQGGKRAGSIAIYLEPWHGDIFFFLDLKKNTGAETERARDLFLALMVNDIFMQRVEDDGVWSLMCPAECPDILNKYGQEFNTIYEKYESEGKFLKQIPARDLWFKIMETQIETGVPYIVFKDAANYKSNQINIGVINGSNLCVSGDTMVLTSNGYQCIKTLENQYVDVWNGEEFSNVVIKKTGENQNLMEIEFSNGSVLKCTPYHTFYISTDETDCGKKSASELQINDRLIDTKFPVIDLPLKTDQIIIGISTTSTTAEGFYDDGISVPMNNSMSMKRSWLNSFLSKHYEKCTSNGSEIKINLDNQKLLNNAKLVLQTMGCNPVIENKQLIIGSNDIYVLLKHVHSKATENKNWMYYELCNHGLEIFSYFDISKVKFNEDSTESINDPKITVTKITELKEKEDTYCFTEPKRGMGIFNGIIAGNCAEILEVSSADEYSVCNLCSICLPKYIKIVNGVTIFDYQELYRVARIAARNLNNIIDINFYPVDKTKVSNLKHRPIGIGVQGLADVYAIFKTPFDSNLARDINKKIFETIYFGALTESMVMAQEQGPYETFWGSPLSKGNFQFDLWNFDRSQLSGMWDWEELMKQILMHGVRNSLVTTVMPTASTSQIRANNECCEPYTENIYTRSTLAGDFYVINIHLMKVLMELGLWNSDMVDLIKYYEGSIANIPGIPDDIKEIYRTVWEIPQKSIIEMAADRGPFIDQTQSMNIFIAKPSFARLNTCLFYSWKKGLKTGIYYLRSKAASEANQFGIDIDKIKEIEEKYKLTPKITSDILADQSKIIPDVMLSKDNATDMRPCQYIPKHLRKKGDCSSCGA